MRMKRSSAIAAIVAVFSLYDVATTFAANTAVPCLAQMKAIIATSGNATILNAAVTVDSYSSSNGPYGGSNIKSNGDIIAGGTIINNGATIKGIATSNTPTNLPTVAVPSGAINLPLGSSAPGTININNQSSSLILTPGIYVIGYLNVNSPGALVISPAGPVTIYVTQGLNLGGNENPNGIPNNLTFVVASSSTINVNSSGSLHGNIYAPTAPINISSTVYGYVVGSSVTLNSGASVHRDESESCANVGVKPSLACVMKVDTATYGAIFGYTNNSGSNVVLGAGPNNFLASGPVDRGQPILFVPGHVQMATFQAFPPTGSITYTIAQASVTASANSPPCSNALVATMKTLYKRGSPEIGLVGQQIAAIVGSPNFATMLATARAQTPAPTPYQASMLDAMSLMASNSDLLVDDGNMTARKLQRLTILQATLLSNPAVVQIRLLGDAQRATPAQVTCDALDTINAAQPAFKSPPPQTGSLSAQVDALLKSGSLKAARDAVGGVATGPQSSALLTMNGLILAAFRPAEALDGLQLPGTPVPTCWTCWVEGVGAGLVGAYLGGIAGGYLGGVFTGGDPVGIGVGVVIGVAIGGYYGFKFGYGGFHLGAGGGRSCQDWCDDHGCSDSGPCAGDGTDSYLIATYNKGTLSQCTVPCQSDSACGANQVCVQSCCYDKSNYAANCPTASVCSQSSDCKSGNNCVFGCCIGDCGYNGRSCATFAEPLTCGGASGNQTCDPGSTCGTAGCCQFIIQ